MLAVSSNSFSVIYSTLVRIETTLDPNLATVGTGVEEVRE